MNNIEKLIKELCPNGVEWKELGEVAKIEIGKQLNRTLLFDNGIYPVQNGGIEPSGFYDEYNTDENTITISQGGASAGFVNFITDKFWAGAHCYVIKKTDDVLLYKYVYYVLKNGQINLQNSKLGAGIPGLNRNTLSKFPIPIPPLPIQQEIVNILDKFTALEAELQAELDARRKQYEYYREKLLTFSEIETHGGVSSLLSASYAEWKTLGEVCLFRNGKGHEKDIVEDGDYIVVNSKFVSTEGKVVKYSDKQISPLYIDDILMVMSDLPNGKALAKTYIVSKNNKYTLNQRIGALTAKYKERTNPKFLYYILNRNKQLLRYDNGADQTNLRKDDILTISIPIPSLSEQNRIVGILDKFEELVNQSLPTEIEARRKQYEHYRERLLTF